MAKFDKNIIYMRSENARMRIKDLSVHLFKSPQRLKYSISTLEKEGILRDPYCIFDYSYFGLILFRVYFKGGYIGELDKKRILQILSADPYITAIYELTGEFDLAIEFASPNPSKFNKELKKIAALTPTLKDYKIILNLVTYVYPRNYLSHNHNLHRINIERLLGGDREQEVFSENELAVIGSLLANPILRYTGIAKDSGLNVKTVKSVLDNLMKRRIILGFKYIVDTNKLGVSKSRLFLKLHNLSPEREAELKNYLSTIQEIVQVNKTVGDWDMELDIEALDKTRVRYLIVDMREKFRDLIESFNLIEFFNYYKRSYLPTYLFEKK